MIPLQGARVDEVLGHVIHSIHERERVLGTKGGEILFLFRLWEFHLIDTRHAEGVCFAGPDLLPVTDQKEKPCEYTKAKSVRVLEQGCVCVCVCV